MGLRSDELKLKLPDKNGQLGEIGLGAGGSPDVGNGGIEAALVVAVGGIESAVDAAGVPGEFHEGEDGEGGPLVVIGGFDHAPEEEAVEDEGAGGVGVFAGVGVAEAGDKAEEAAEPRFLVGAGGVGIEGSDGGGG